MANELAGKRVLVFGSYVTDLCGRAGAFPKPGETIKGSTFKLGPGGKGSNQAVAAKRAGADVTLITRLGGDPLGRLALDFYAAEGMRTDGILIDPDRDTGAALISVNERTAQNQIIVIGGACEHFTEAELPAILDRVAAADLLLLQLETNLEPVHAVLNYAKDQGIFTILNPAPAQYLADKFYRCVDILNPNETEAEALTGVRVTDRESVREAARTLLDKGVGKVVITLGDQGAYACDGGSEQFFEAADCGAAVDTTGAGDAFSGALAAAIAEGLPFFDAVAFGGAAAGLAVTRHGTALAMPCRTEIDAALALHQKGGRVQ